MSESSQMDPELGREVGVGVIGRELKLLWEEDQARTNASLMNVAVYSEDPTALRRNSEIIRRLTRDHACRALLVSIDREAAEPSIRAWITAHCHLVDGRKTVCCEQIAFELRGRSRGRLRNTVFAHLASDLPLIFWWQGELSPLFEESLYSLIDRFIFDSASWRKDPLGSFEALEAAVSQSARPFVVQDLAWTRTYHYRLAVAALFDTPQAQAALPEVVEVEIVAHPDHRMSALQLLAWLSTQAQWALLAVEELAEATLVRFGGRSGEIQARLVEAADSAPLGRLELRGGGMRLAVWRDLGGAHLFQDLQTGSARIEAVSPADSEEDAELIADQLARGGKNSLFWRTLPRFMQLLRAGGAKRA